VVFLVVNKEIKQELNHKLRSEERKSKPGCKFLWFFFLSADFTSESHFPRLYRVNTEAI